MQTNREFELLSNHLTGLWPSVWVEAAIRAQHDVSALIAQRTEIHQMVVERSRLGCRVTFVGEELAVRLSGVKLLHGVEFAEISLPLRLTALDQNIGWMDLRVTDSHGYAHVVEIEALAVLPAGVPD
jgi:hypothetical protein